MTPEGEGHDRRPLVRPAVAQEELVRRPGDAIQLAAALILLLLLGLRADDGTRVGRDLFALVNNLPDGLEGFFRGLYRLGGLWFVAAAAGAAALLRRWRLARDVLVAGVAAWAIGSFLAVLVNGQGVSDAAEAVIRTGAGPTFPLVRTGTVLAVVLVAAPYLSRPLRRLGAAVVLAVSFAGMYLAVGATEDVLGGLALGWACAEAVHLAFRAPAGRPTVAQVRDALAELGLEADRVTLAPERRQGATLMVAETDAGERYSVKVLGRDQRDTQFLSKAWRWLTTKDSGPTLYLTRIQEVEHEAYVDLLAARSGTRVPEVVAAGTAGPEAAVLVERRPEGQTVAELREDETTDALLDEVWTEVAHLHDGRIAHGSLSADHLLASEDGTVTITDFARASTAASREDRAVDVAEVLAWSSVLVGHERAADAAIRSLGQPEVEAALSRLQPVALTHTTRRSMKSDRKHLDELRKTTAEQLGVEVPAIEELRRVKPSSIFMAAATLFAVFYLLGQAGDFSDLGDALADASVPWLVFAFLLSFIPRVAGSTAIMAAAPIKLQLGPTFELQYATAFATLAAPGGYGASVMNIRYLQKQGMDVTTAVGPSLLVSWSGSAVQTVLFVVALIVTGQTSEVSSTLSGSARVIVLAIIVVGVALGLIWRLPKLRHLVLPPLKRIYETFRQVFAHPRRAAVLLGSAAASSIGFALTLGACVHAYGGNLSLASLIVVNIGASTLSSVVPTPGGMGVAEAAMVAGLTAVGLPSDIAIPAVLTHRIYTFWFPPVVGWFTTRVLIRRGYL